MNSPEKIYTEIDKQIEAGFTGAEIKQNLLSQNFTPHEIEVAMRQRKVNAAKQPKSSGKVGIVSLLISVYFIINGSVKISSAPSGSFLYSWGLVMLSVGIIGVIWKGVDMARR
jgi:hypothetical protein